MTAPVHPIPAHPPAAGAPAATAPLGGRGTVSSVALTPHELRALDFIRDRIAATGSSPTYQEISTELGWSAKSGAHRIVDSLIRQGALVRRPNTLRGLALADGPRLFTVPTAALRAELARRGA